MATQSITDDGVVGERVNRPLAGLAYYREFGAQFRSLGDSRYEGPSRSLKGKRYEINLEEETCTCPDFALGHHVCAHIYGMVIAAAKPIRVKKNKERNHSSLAQVMRNIDNLGA